MRATTINNLTPATTYARPYERLALAIVLTAIKELKSKSLARRLDAVLWLVENASLFTEGAGMEVDPVTWLTKGARIGKSASKVERSQNEY